MKKGVLRARAPAPLALPRPGPGRKASWAKPTSAAVGREAGGRAARTLMALGATGLPREGAEKGRDVAGILGVPETPFPAPMRQGRAGAAPGPGEEGPPQRAARRPRGRARKVPMS